MVRISYELISSFTKKISRRSWNVESIVPRHDFVFYISEVEKY